jgi:glutathionylspermidine synthase
MQRIKTAPRHHWQEAVEKIGFGFHSLDVPYWDESAYYSFSMEEIDLIEKATADLWDKCLIAVQHVMDHNLYAQFYIPENIVPLIVKSWEEDHPSIYGRFDFCFKNNTLKLLEFNADTPTSLYEAGIVQWYWLQDFDASKDQFNSIHEKLVAYWKELKPYLHPGTLHFSCLKETLEDLTNTEYIRDCAIQAGLDTQLVFIDDIGWDPDRHVFVDLDNKPIQNMFKLYPWEWLATDEFGPNILADRNQTKWIEPAWKMILSNKVILAVLWELFPDCPYLLPTYFEKKNLLNYARKPLLSREGANIDLVMNNTTLLQTDGEYGEEGYIYQQLFELPAYEGNYPVIGSWVIGQEPAGMGIRESDGLITNNLSRFVPHLIN